MVKREPGWKQALKEPNAIGWIGFLILMVLIGLGALYFDRGSSPGASYLQPPVKSQAR
jgi:hypothetical protein